MHQDNDKTIRVYYNSACPVCRAGIKSQKAKMTECEVGWLDVHANPNLVKHINAELEFVRKRLHVVDDAGKIHVGFAAFLAIWAHSPKERWKAKLFGFPLIKPICAFGYNFFAWGLYHWNRKKKHW